MAFTISLLKKAAQKTNMTSTDAHIAHNTKIKATPADSGPAVSANDKARTEISHHRDLSKDSDQTNGSGPSIWDRNPKNGETTTTTITTPGTTPPETPNRTTKFTNRVENGVLPGLDPRARTPKLVTVNMTEDACFDAMRPKPPEDGITTPIGRKPLVSLKSKVKEKVDRLKSHLLPKKHVKKHKKLQNLQQNHHILSNVISRPSESPEHACETPIVYTAPVGQTVTKAKNDPYKYLPPHLHPRNPSPPTAEPKLSMTIATNACDPLEPLERRMAEIDAEEADQGAEDTRSSRGLILEADDARSLTVSEEFSLWKVAHPRQRPITSSQPVFFATPTSRPPTQFSPADRMLSAVEQDGLTKETRALFDITYAHMERAEKVMRDLRQDMRTMTEEKRALQDRLTYEHGRAEQFLKRNQHETCAMNNVKRELDKLKAEFERLGKHSVQGPAIQLPEEDKEGAESEFEEVESEDGDETKGESGDVGEDDDDSDPDDEPDLVFQDRDHVVGQLPAAFDFEYGPSMPYQTAHDEFGDELMMASGQASQPEIVRNIEHGIPYVDLAPPEVSGRQVRFEEAEYQNYEPFQEALSDKASPREHPYLATGDVADDSDDRTSTGSGELFETTDFISSTAIAGPNNTATCILTHAHSFKISDDPRCCDCYTSSQYIDPTKQKWWNDTSKTGTRAVFEILTGGASVSTYKAVTHKSTNYKFDFSLRDADNVGPYNDWECKKDGIELEYATKLAENVRDGCWEDGVRYEDRVKEWDEKVGEKKIREATAAAGYGKINTHRKEVKAMMPGARGVERLGAVVVKRIQ